MYKSGAFTFGLLASSLVMLAVMPLLNQNNNSFLPNVKAQEYGTYDDDYDNSYSTYPTDDKKYKCRTGPLEGSVVSSVEFCLSEGPSKDFFIFPANKVAELGDKWWQWILSLDVKTNPNPFTETDQEGCDVGLQENGKLLFLVGTSKNFTTYPDNGFPVHECAIKKGTQILFPILNVFCSSLDNPPLETEAEQRLCANDAQDRGQDYYLEIDGIKVKNSNQLEEKYRIDSPAGGFTFIGVENSPYGIVGTGKAVSDGVWILLEELKPGEHTIKFSGTFDWSDFPPPFNGIFEFGATYILYVHPGYY